MSLPRTAHLLALFLVVMVGSAAAQETIESPYTTSWLREGLLIGGGVANGIVASSFNDTVSAITIAELSALDRNSINGFDRFAAGNYSPTASHVSDYMLAASLLSPFGLIIADGRIRQDWDKISVMYLETILWSALLPSYTKGTVQRIRPFAYNTETPLEEREEPETRRSFFSGHASLTFSSAVFLAKVYSDYYPDSDYKPYVWGGSLAVAGTIGYLRVHAGAHFPTDVLVGAIVGSAVGYLIPMLHATGTDKDDASLMIFPGGVMLGYRF